MHAQGVDVTDTYRVPTGKRAIVTSFVAAKSDTPQVGSIWLQVAGMWCVCIALPVTKATTSMEMRIVAYQGELLQLLTVSAAITGVVSGYLFDDSVGAPPENKPAPPGLIGPGPDDIWPKAA